MAWQQRSISILAVLLLLAPADAAIETCWSGTAARWWIVTAVGLFLAGMLWGWRRLSPATRLAASPTFLLALLAATAWLPGGTLNGLVVFGQRSSTLLTATTAGALVVAGVAIVRWRSLPLAARFMLGGLATYGMAALLMGLRAHASYPSLLHGGGPLQVLPVWLRGAVVGCAVVLPLGWLAQIVADARRGAGPWRWRQTIALTLSLLMVMSGFVARDGSAGPSYSSSRSSATRRTALLEGSLRALEDGEREAPGDRWDIRKLVDRIGTAPEDAFAFMRDETSWIPYRGLLRGPRGVLMERKGNSLDRALLLGTLLRETGQTVRLAHAELTRANAISTLPAALARGAVLDALPADEAIDDDIDLSNLAAGYGLDEAQIAPRLRLLSDARKRVLAQVAARVPDQTRRLKAAASGTGADAERGIRLEASLEALQDHWWIQRQEGENWIDLDPMTEQPGRSLARASQIVDLDGVDEALRHQIVLRVVSERWAGGAVAEHTDLEHTLMPSDLIGTPIVLRFEPQQWPELLSSEEGDPRSALATAALAQHGWRAALRIGSDVVAEASLSDSAEAAPAGPDPIGQYGSGTVKQGQALIDALDDSPSPGSEATATSDSQTLPLTATWIECEIRVPGRPPRTIRRALFDLIGPAGRAVTPIPEPRLDRTGRLARSLALMTETEILPIVCAIPQEFVTHLATGALLSNRDTLRALVSGLVPEEGASAQELMKALAPMPSPLYTLAVARFAWNPKADELFLEAPNILARHVFLAEVRGGVALWQATDIVANEVGVAPLVSDGFGARLTQGVIDTNAEALLQVGLAAPGNTAEAYASPGEWLTVASRGASQLERLRLPDDARRRIAQDLADGYLVVAPAAPVPLGADAFVGWWRVDPVRGDALGLASTGWGQSMVEYGLLLSSILIFGGIEFWACLSGLQVEEEPLTGSEADEKLRGIPLPSRASPTRDHPLVQGPKGTAGSCIGKAMLGAVFGLAFGLLISRAPGMSSGGGARGGRPGGTTRPLGPPPGSGSSKKGYSPPGGGGADPLGKTDPGVDPHGNTDPVGSGRPPGDGSRTAPLGSGRGGRAAEAKAPADPLPDWAESARREYVAAVEESKVATDRYFDEVQKYVRTPNKVHEDGTIERPQIPPQLEAARNNSTEKVNKVIETGRAWKSAKKKLEIDEKLKLSPNAKSIGGFAGVGGALDPAEIP